MMDFSNSDQRRILLIDRDSRMQQLRASALRNHEIEVHIASDVNDAGRFFTTCPYDLILLAAEENSQEAALICEQLAKCRPRQRIAILVGAPHYVRELGRKRRGARPGQPTDRPSVMADMAPTQPTQWHVMLEHFLAAG